MKLFHASDFHLDSPLSGLTAEKSAQRRRELRDIPARLAKLARAEAVDLVLLPGDLFDGERVYPETVRVLSQALADMSVPVFIAPGNHDYYHSRSPYANQPWPENVHIFTQSALEEVELPGLNCVVHGCAFTAPHREDDPLAGFTAPSDGRLHLLCVHGEVGAVGSYAPMDPKSLEKSGVTYAALGHVHAANGGKAGDTLWAYPGCPEGRGFDELGEKGALIVSFDKGAQPSPKFAPVCRRQYRIETIEVDGFASALAQAESPDLVRFLLSGESRFAPDLAALTAQAAPHFFHVELQDRTTLPQDLWARADEDSLTGLFLREMRQRLDSADESEKDKLLLAARFGLAALEGGGGRPAMKIKKMTATFGGLDNAVLTPGEGLTVITAPNETGKSTWAGFLKAMLYGIDTRERDKTGFLADKTRYQPWSGAPMTGEMQVEWQGKDVTIRRFPTRTNPFGGFEAVYTTTGDPVPGLTAANVGEQLTGVGREVYLRSAFVGQGGAAIGSSKELEARVAALATSGQEDVSYSAVERVLKDWRNRRRANRANGLIPQIEEEKSGLESVLREMAETRRRKDQAERELVRLQEKQRELQSDLHIWERLERHELNRRYAEAYTEWEKAKAAIPADRPHPVFGTMSGEDAWAFAQKKQKAREAVEEENRRREAQRSELEQTCRGQRQTVLLCGILAVVMLLVGLGLALWSGKWAASFARTGGIATAAVIVSVIFARRLKNSRRELSGIDLLPVPEEDNWLNQAAEYRETLAKAQQARDLEAAARRRVDDLAAQGGQLFDTLEMLYPPAQSKAATAAQLAGLERELTRTRDELARTEGALAHMGGPEDIEARRSGLDAQLAQRLEEYDALSTALDALSTANAALRERFSPALNREAGAVFAALTGGRWDKLVLTRDFAAQAVGEDGTLPRSWLALSAGTAEQLYLAVRLAICALSVPDAPVVLDDALAAFDDSRCALALDFLRGAARDRQILLFSCHDREARWAREREIPVIQL